MQAAITSCSTAITLQILAMTITTDSYVQFSAAKSPAATKDASKDAPTTGDSAENAELTRARFELSDLRLQITELSSGLSSKELELADSQREIARLKALLQSR
jgi:peptidoglycan hydrolase CwlO-like protein